MKRPPGSSRYRSDTRATPSEPLPAGQKIRDSHDRRVGVILDHACQYSHPKAPPVYSYLIRWEDGQIQAFSEAAIGNPHGLELVD